MAQLGLEVNDLSVARQNYSYIGSTTLALAAGGHDASDRTASTEEWGFPPATQAKLREGMIFLFGGKTLKGFGKMRLGYP